MNNEATLGKMHAMKLHGMVRAFKTTMEVGRNNEMTGDELVTHLIDAEWDQRHDSRLNRLIRNAKFRYQASMEQMDFRLRRNLDKNSLMRFADCSWIKRKQNIIITGPTGVGKSFVACALGHQACLYGLRVLYFNATKLFAALKLKGADGSYVKEINRIQRHDLLVLDDFGLDCLDKQSRLSLMEIVEDRNGVKSTIITSQQPVKNWHEIIGDPTIADAVCDRVIHSSHRIEIKGESVRKKFQEDLT